MESPFNHKVPLLSLLFSCYKTITVSEVQRNREKKKKTTDKESWAFTPALSLTQCVTYLPLPLFTQAYFFLYKKELLGWMIS